MKRILHVLLCFLFPIFLYGHSDEELMLYVNEGILEPIELTFRDCTESDRYITKYHLNEDEIRMVGSWGFDGTINKAESPIFRKYGPGYLIFFYPNRYFYTTNGDYGRYKGDTFPYTENGEVVYTVGQWRVENKKLQVMFIAKIIMNDNEIKDRHKRYAVKYVRDNAYYTIFSIPTYRIGYFNTEPFNWGALPSSLLESLDFKNDDAPRTRSLPKGRWEEYLGLLIKDYPGHDFLLNPRKNDANYLIELTYVWVW
jgi:hypothetical protein